MGKELLKRGGLARMQTWQAGVPACEVKWYRCAPDALVYEGWSTFRHRYYSTNSKPVQGACFIDKNPDHTGVGIQWPYAIGDCDERIPYPYASQVPPAGYLGQRPCGSDAVARRGGVVGVDPSFDCDENGRPECCGENVLFLRGGASVGGRLNMVGACRIFYGSCLTLRGGAVAGGPLTLAPGDVGLTLSGGAVAGGPLTLGTPASLTLSGGAVAGGPLTLTGIGGGGPSFVAASPLVTGEGTVTVSVPAGESGDHVLLLWGTAAYSGGGVMTGPGGDWTAGGEYDVTPGYVAWYTAAYDDVGGETVDVGMTAPDRGTALALVYRGGDPIDPRTVLSGSSASVNPGPYTVLPPDGGLVIWGGWVDDVWGPVSTPGIDYATAGGGGLAEALFLFREDIPADDYDSASDRTSSDDWAAIVLVVPPT